MLKQFQAEPFPLSFNPQTTALLMIDMQRDFVELGGFGEALGNDVNLVRSAIQPCKRMLSAARQAGIFILHTREGHRADLSDCPPAKLTGRENLYWRMWTKRAYSYSWRRRTRYYS
ncbi:cysteine hydrolase family protein [Avibacterium paragallinarum]|uniref:cysteine hydrolase family protein n=1 Tax=Avibacterium paragallinarum TaxID=728 RepID=UPI000AD4E529|nr:cysteine hydrolase family protein [Avibacterium paragallinarum]